MTEQNELASGKGLSLIKSYLMASESPDGYQVIYASKIFYQRHFNRVVAVAKPLGFREIDETVLMPWIAFGYGFVPPLGILGKKLFKIIRPMSNKEYLSVFSDLIFSNTRMRIKEIREIHLTEAKNRLFS